MIPAYSEGIGLKEGIFNKEELLGVVESELLQ